MSIVAEDLVQQRVFVPGPSGEGFTIGLYLEHLEEASFLYEQRLVLLDDPELTWLDLADYEARFEAHIDALVLGEDLALGVCRQQALEGDAGELHAAMRVFCRQNRPDLALEVMDATDPEDDERVRALADALCHELPASWQQALSEKLREGHPVALLTVPRAFGYRRMPAAQELLSILSSDEESVVSDVAWSLGRLRDQRARGTLYKPRLQQGMDEVRSAAALALLRIGDPSVVQYCAGRASSDAWAALPLGLGGSKAQVNTLLGAAASENVTPDTLLALGLLGDVTAVDLLLYSLERPDLAPAAAQALNLITGADLFVETFIPEPVDEDELFPDEVEQHPANGAGEQQGITVVVPDPRPEPWRRWWEGEGASFQAGVRYRNGKAYSPAELLENVRSERLPRAVRQLACEELAIRYACDVPVETDMFVVHQVEAFSKIDAWVKANGHVFKEGKWYLAGKPYSW